MKDKSNIELIDWEDAFNSAVKFPNQINLRDYVDELLRRQASLSYNQALNDMLESLPELVEENEGYRAAQTAYNTALSEVRAKLESLKKS